MHTLRLFSIIAWIALPAVMYGGYALLGLLTRGGLSEFQQTYFRAGHAHAGVLLLMALLYHHYMEQTRLSPAIKVGAAAAFATGQRLLQKVHGVEQVAARQEDRLPRGSQVRSLE